MVAAHRHDLSSCVGESLSRQMAWRTSFLEVNRVVLWAADVEGHVRRKMAPVRARHMRRLIGHSLRRGWEWSRLPVVRPLWCVKQVKGVVGLHPFTAVAPQLVQAEAIHFEQEL